MFVCLTCFVLFCLLFSLCALCEILIECAMLAIGELSAIRALFSLYEFSTLCALFAVCELCHCGYRGASIKNQRKQTQRGATQLSWLAGVWQALPTVFVPCGRMHDLLSAKLLVLTESVYFSRAVLESPTVRLSSSFSFSSRWRSERPIRAPPRLSLSSLPKVALETVPVMSSLRSTR